MADDLRDVFVSPNVEDSNGEPANVVDVLDSIAVAGQTIARAICPPHHFHGRDDAGGAVSSLTEAVMGITAGLVAVSRAIDNLAEAVREKK